MTDQGAFDFEDFNKRVQEQRDKEHTEARAGRDALRGRLEKAETARAELDEEIAGLEEQIDVIDKFLGDEESVAPRDSGVKRTLETIAPKIDGWRFEAVVEAVREYKPRVKPSSVRSALARLVRDKVLSTNGARGEKSWSYIPKPLPIAEAAHAALRDTIEAANKRPLPEASKTAVVTTETASPSLSREPAPAKPKTEDEILSELQRRITEAVAKNPDGADPKVLAWIVTDVGATHEQFELAAKRLEEAGVIEQGKSLDEAGGHVLRKPAEPGSKEELKRTPVQGRMGFPGAEKPPHM